MPVPLVIFGRAAYQACLFIGFARASAEELLTFSFQRLLATVPFLAVRALAALTWPGVGSWASATFSAMIDNSTPEPDVPPIMHGHGGHERWAWFVAVAQPLLVGLCSWLHH
eukprot:2700027-Pyramimonas_sp.AAC.1